MTEASWGDAGTPDIDWRMSAALEDVPRGDDEFPEVTNLASEVRAWLALDPEHRTAATLTPERALLIDGASLHELRGDHIGTLAERLPGDATGSPEKTGLDDAG